MPPARLCLPLAAAGLIVGWLSAAEPLSTALMLWHLRTTHAEMFIPAAALSAVNAAILEQITWDKEHP